MTNTTAATWSRLISTAMGHVDSMYPIHDVIMTILHLRVLPLCPLPQSYPEKYIRLIPIEGHSASYLIGTSQNSRSSKTRRV